MGLISRVSSRTYRFFQKMFKSLILKQSIRPVVRPSLNLSLPVNIAVGNVNLFKTQYRWQSNDAKTEEAKTEEAKTEEPIEAKEDKEKEPPMNKYAAMEKQEIIEI